MKMWYEVYAEPRIRPNTKAYYTNYIENHIIPGIGNISLDKLTTIQIQRFYNNLQKTGRVQRKNFPELKDKSLSPRVVRWRSGSSSPTPPKAANCRSLKRKK